MNVSQDHLFSPTDTTLGNIILLNIPKAAEQFGESVNNIIINDFLVQAGFLSKEEAQFLFIIEKTNVVKETAEVGKNIITIEGMIIGEVICMGPATLDNELFIPTTETIAEFSDDVGGQLKTIAGQADDMVSQGGRVGGTLKHSAAENIINSSTTGYTTEVSYLNGRIVPRGTPGSVRLDVITGNPNNPTAVFDFKFGKAGLTNARINQIMSHLPDPNIPIFEVRPK